MAVQAPPKTGFEKWQDGIDNAAGDTRWDSWDCEIRMAVDEYDRPFKNSILPRIYCGPARH